MLNLEAQAWDPWIPDPLKPPQRPMVDRRESRAQISDGGSLRPGPKTPAFGPKAFELGFWIRSLGLKVEGLIGVWVSDLGFWGFGFGFRVCKYGLCGSGPTFYFEICLRQAVVGCSCHRGVRISSAAGPDSLAGLGSERASSC